MRWITVCSTCRRPATLIVTGRIPRRTCYSALSCDTCREKHRVHAAKAGPVQEEELEHRAQDPLF